MTSLDTRTGRRSLPLGDILIAASSWAVATSGLALGGKPLWFAVVVLAVPMVAFASVGHIAGRGAIVACIASALGVGLAGSEVWAAAGLIGLVDLAALGGGIAADRLGPEAMPSAPAAGGRRMTIVVHHKAVAAPIPVDVPSRVARPRRRGRRSVA